jgi:hypothetical protein
MTNVKGRKIKQSKSSLGIFTDFPIFVHGTGEVIHTAPLYKVQRATIVAFKELNNYREPYPLSVSGQSGTYRGTLGFEIGVADGRFFNYLDDETAEELCKPLNPRRKYPLLDFLIIVTYHYTQQRKRVALNFDHFHLRLIFNKRRIEGRLFHNKGTRRIALDELLNRLFDQIRKNIVQSSIGTLTVKKIKTY